MYKFCLKVQDFYEPDKDIDNELKFNNHLEYEDFDEGQDAVLFVSIAWIRV